MSNLKVIIMDADFRPELNLLELDLFLVLLRFLGPLVLLIEKLPIIHNSADGRVGLRGNLDQVKPSFSGEGESLGERQNANLFLVLIDDPDFSGVNHFINPVRPCLFDDRIERTSPDNA